MVERRSCQMSGEKTVSAQDTKPFFEDIVNVDEERDPQLEGADLLYFSLQELATTKRVALLAIIAPCVTIDASPLSEDRARVGLAEEFGVEAALERMRSQDGVDHCYLLVHGPGGDIHSSYYIASSLKNFFKEITVFVPRSTSIGGTLLALTGSEIVMGEMSRLSPVEEQLPYKDTYISSSAAEMAFYRCQRWFDDTPHEEASYPQRAMVDKLDPFIMESLSTRAEMASVYALNICEGDIDEGIFHLNFLDRGRAKFCGLPVVDARSRGDVWDVMRLWLSQYLFSQSTGSYIRYVLPADSEGGDDGTSCLSEELGSVETT